MKPLVIRKSRQKSIKYLVGSIVILSFFIYRFFTDTTQYPKGNSFYWIAIALFGFTTCYFSYDFFCKVPLYTLTDKGVQQGNSSSITQWTDLSTFECKSPYQKYITPKYAILYDKAGNEALTIDFTHSDISIERMEKILKKKLKEK
jgi:hypothetical protein